MSVQASARPKRPGREQRAELRETHGALTAQSWVSRGGRAVCLLAWGSKQGRLTPQELRALGVAFIGVAAAAEGDAALIRALCEEAGLDVPTARQVLSTVRGYREAAAALALTPALYAGCPYPGAHVHPGPDGDDDEQDEPATG